MELSRILRVARFLECLYRPCILLASRALNLLLFGMPLPMGACLGGGFVVFVSEWLLRDRVLVGLDSWMARSLVFGCEGGTGVTKLFPAAFLCGALVPRLVEFLKLFPILVFVNLLIRISQRVIILLMFIGGLWDDIWWTRRLWLCAADFRRF